MMRNFIVICIDCLRYDFFKKYLTTSDTFFKELNTDTLFFESAYTTAPWTYPATNSILTGLYPHHHGARHEGIYRHTVKDPWPSKLNDNIPNIFSALKPYGYYSLGISTIFWALNENCDYQGCDSIIRSEEQDVFYKNIKAEWVIDSFKNKVKEKAVNKSFIAYLHFCDLHRPFDIDVALKHITEPVEVLEGVEEWDLRPYLNDPGKLANFKAGKQKLYFALIDYVFNQIHELINFLMDVNVFDDTTIIITSDHGEEFWDHKDFQIKNYDCGLRSQKKWLAGTGHGHTLFNEIIHVPLTMINPTFKLEPELLFTPVSLVDIFPTILDIAKIEERYDLDGNSLLHPSLHRELLIESTLYGFERKAILQDHVKHVYSPYENHFTVFNLLSDPIEEHPDEKPSIPTIKSKLDYLFQKEIVFSKAVAN